MRVRPSTSAPWNMSTSGRSRCSPSIRVPRPSGRGSGPRKVPFSLPRIWRNPPPGRGVPWAFRCGDGSAVADLFLEVGASLQHRGVLLQRVRRALQLRHELAVPVLVEALRVGAHPDHAVQHRRHLPHQVGHGARAAVHLVRGVPRVLHVHPLHVARHRGTPLCSASSCPEGTVAAPAVLPASGRNVPPQAGVRPGTPSSIAYVLTTEATALVTSDWVTLLTLTNSAVASDGVKCTRTYPRSLLTKVRCGLLFSSVALGALPVEEIEVPTSSAPTYGALWSK